MPDSTTSDTVGAGMGAAAPMRTRAQVVDARLRAAILRGELKPGERLLPGELAARWDVSPTPLREAIFRLEADGLVESVPHKGARVTPLTRTALTELYELRLQLEPFAMEKAIARRTGDDEETARASHARMRELEHAPDVLVFEQSHRAFHRAMLAGCGSPRLMSMVDSLSLHSSRYWLLRVERAAGMESAHAEHEALLAAFLGEDPAVATGLLRSHIARTLDIVALLPELED